VLRVAKCYTPITFTLPYFYLYRVGILTQISIQTAGLAFGGTGLCSYLVPVFLYDGSCAEHLTVESYESYTVIICQQSYLLLFGIPSPTHSFIPGLKPSFSVNPSHHSPSFFLQDSLHRFPRLFTVISEHICFLLFSFSVLHFLVVGFRAVD